MSSKSKKNKKQLRCIRIYSSENTGVFYNYVKPKDVKTIIEVKKYDNKVRKHVLFIERKKTKKKSN